MHEFMCDGQRVSARFKRCYLEDESHAICHWGAGVYLVFTVATVKLQIWGPIRQLCSGRTD